LPAAVLNKSKALCGLSTLRNRYIDGFACLVREAGNSYTRVRHELTQMVQLHLCDTLVLFLRISRESALPENASHKFPLCMGARRLQTNMSHWGQRILKSAPTTVWPIADYKYSYTSLTRIRKENAILL
jgi:hypothetical protein